MNSRLLPLVGVLALAGCGGASPEVSTPFGPNTGIASISVFPNGVAISVGDTLRFTADANRSLNVTGFNWSTTNAGLASVDALGLLRGHSAGTVAVWACTRPTTSVCGSATVTVR